MCAPKYRDLRQDVLGSHKTDEGASLRVIAGSAYGHDGPITDLAARPTFIDVELQQGGEFQMPSDAGQTAFIYLEQGTIAVGPEEHEMNMQGPALAVLGPGTWVGTRAKTASRLLFAAAHPLNEPIARYGPFVMNTHAEIEETIHDLRTGRFIRHAPTHA
jgi:quercetin 2,3-dioxygenase